MERNEMIKQMLDFNKATFDNTFRAITMLQDQMEQFASTMLKQTTGVSDEGTRVIDEWIKAYKKGRDDYKKFIDDNFKKVEDFFGSQEKSKPAAKS